MQTHVLTHQDIEILLQQNKVITYRLELLNSNMKVINALEGNLISDSLSIDSNSDIRRTYTCELVITNNSFLIGEDTNIWFDKFIRPYIGIIHQRSQTVKWYCLGTFLYTDLNYNYDCITRTLSLTCNDMMCLLNDTRKGQLDQYKRKINADSDARSVIISLLNEIGITKYYIEFNHNGNLASTFSIPYDLEYGAGTTVYTIIKDIVDLYSGSQMYFDIDGVFNIRRIPTKNDEKSIFTNDILSQIVISEDLSTSFNNIYNKIIIWGKVNEPNFYSTNVLMMYSCYVVTIDEDRSDSDKTNWIIYDKYTIGDKVSIRIPSSNSYNATLNINGLGEVPITYESGEPIESDLLNKNQDYVFRYRELNGIKQFILLGQYQCYAEAYLTNNETDNNLYAVIDKDTNLSIEKIGTITKVLSGGGYDTLYTDTLTLQRCHLELYNNSNMKETLTLNTLLIPWLDVNQKITYKTKSTNQECDYLITSISCNNANFTMSLNLNKYYPDYI